MYSVTGDKENSTKKNFTENYFKLKLVDLVSGGYFINRDTPTSFPQD